jgi:hypothetical protein
MEGGSASESYATGGATAGDASYVGGFAGWGTAIQNAYANGTVKGGTSANIGGMAGEFAGAQIVSTYSLGLVKGTNAGGYLGIAEDAHFANAYWNTDTSSKGRKHGCGGQKCGRSVSPLTTQEFQTGLPSGFDSAIWAQNPNINDGYPYLINNPPQ